MQIDASQFEFPQKQPVREGLHLDSILRDAAVSRFPTPLPVPALDGVAHPMRMSAPRPPHLEQRRRAR